MDRIFILNILNILVQYIPSFAPEGKQRHEVGGVDFGVFVEVGLFSGEAGSPANSLRIFFDNDGQDAQDLRKEVSDQLFLLFCESCAFLRLSACGFVVTGVFQDRGYILTRHPQIGIRKGDSRV